MWHYIIIIIIIIIIVLHSRIQLFTLKVSDCTTTLNIWHTQSIITSKFDVVDSIKY